MLDLPRWTFLFGIAGLIVAFDAIVFPPYIQLIILLSFFLVIVPIMYYLRRVHPVAITSVPMQLEQDDKKDTFKKKLIPFDGCFLERTPIKFELLCVVLLILSLIGSYVSGIINFFVIMFSDFGFPASQTVSLLFSVTILVLAFSLLIFIVFIITYIYQIFLGYIIKELVLYKCMLFVFFLGFTNIVIELLPEPGLMNPGSFHTALMLLIAFPGVVIGTIFVITLIFLILNGIRATRIKH